MNRDARGLILGFVAVLLLRLSLTEQYLLYVKSSMRPFLIVSGVLLAGLAARDLILRGSEDDMAMGEGSVGHDPNSHDGMEDHDHAGHRIGALPWLLVAPFIVVFAIGPNPLGSFMAERQPERRLDADAEEASTESGYPPLPPAVDGAVELHLANFAYRAAYDEGRQMDGVLIRLEGFVARDASGAGDTFLLTKFVLSCCAADGYPVSVRAHGIDPVPASDTWLEVEGYWIPHDEGSVPDVDEFEIVDWEEIPVPDDPYL